MSEDRSAGILLHISSLPGKYGIGTLGAEAYRFVDLLAKNKIKYWQILPLVQTGYGDSPYQSVYSGSGNPYFIDFDMLAEEGLLKKSELAACRNAAEGVDYAFLYEKKYAVLRRAFRRFNESDPAFVAFAEGGTFEGYALFMALKQNFGGVSFDRWPKKYKHADEGALRKFKEEHLEEYRFWLFLQFEFFKQWNALKHYANERGVYLIGDLPLYVAYDSADVWMSPKLFKLNPDLSLKKVAGVPPDYFSATGQLWGNPVYRWSEHKKDGYAWWIERLRQAFLLYDVVRLDHFRGFDRYYEIEAGSDTACEGVWHSGPKEELFRCAEAALGKLKIIAEDLGIQDAGVRRLVRVTGYPRMKVMGFAFDGNADNPYLPKHIEKNSVCYTGTHDNDTMLGYIRSLDENGFRVFLESVQASLRESGEKYAFRGEKSLVRQVVKIALQCASCLTVIPIQDILVLGSEARMNLPGKLGGNWQFRLKRPLTEKDLQSFGELVAETGREN